MPDQLTKTLECIEKKLDEVRLDVKGLSTEMREVKSDVKTLSKYPAKIREIDTRVEHNEEEIKSIRSRSWTVTILVISSLLAAACSITVHFFTG